MSAGDMFAPLADDYAAYRPGYPRQVVDELVRTCALTRHWSVADIGSGTGNAARLFLEAGCRVTGVEPNREMREAGERLWKSCPGFVSIDGAAERIPIGTHSVDLVTVGQALHWFDVDRAGAEFRRILRPDGWIAVMWNDRICDASRFSSEYAQLTRSYATKHPSSCSDRPLGEGLDRLFRSASPHHATFTHRQSFDLRGLLGRARSSGYLPQPDAPDYAQLAAPLADLFARHQQSGMVHFHYATQLYYAPVAATCRRCVGPTGRSAGLVG